MAGINGPDLLDLLEAEDQPDVIHGLMPNMCTACGMTALQVMDAGAAKGRRLYVLGTRGPLSPEPGAPAVDVTCPDCIRVGDEHGGLSAYCDGMQRRQAAAT